MRSSGPVLRSFDWPDPHFETPSASFETAIPSFPTLDRSLETVIRSFGVLARNGDTADRRFGLPGRDRVFPVRGFCLMLSHQEERIMARFPQTEPEIAALAHVVAQGLKEAAEDFPAPPISADELQARLDRFNTAIAATVAAENRLREDHAQKDEALAEVVDGLKADLRYAEVTVRDQPEKLTRLGWGPRRSGSSLRSPGEVRDISIVSEGDTWAVLRWRPPVDGGAPAFYRIQRRQEGASWEDAGTATGTEQLMSNQPRGVELHYRVVAVNKAGDGPPSATVTLVL